MINELINSLVLIIDYELENIFFFAAINYWLRSEFDNSYYNKQTPIDILIKLSSTTDDIFVFNILNFFIVTFIFINYY